MVLWIVLAVVVIALLWLVAIYNRLVRLRALVKEGFSGITVQLRRRADLVPNLVSTVEGYATHEREVLAEVTANRTAPIQAGGGQAAAQGGQAVRARVRRPGGGARGQSPPQAGAQF